MSVLDKIYNANELPEGNDDFAPLPDGVYDAVITSTEVKTSKSSEANKYIEVTYTVTGPTHKGRKIFDLVNFQNSNPTAQTIGLARMRAMLAACNLPSVRDTAEFHNRPLKIKLALDPAKGEYSAKNKIVAVLSSRAAAVPPAAATAPHSAAVAAPAAAAPRSAPWA